METCWDVLCEKLGQQGVFEIQRKKKNPIIGKKSAIFNFSNKKLLCKELYYPALHAHILFDHSSSKSFV